MCEWFRFFMGSIIVRLLSFLCFPVCLRCLVGLHQWRSSRSRIRAFFFSFASVRGYLAQPYPSHFSKVVGQNESRARIPPRLSRRASSPGTVNERATPFLRFTLSTSWILLAHTPPLFRFWLNTRFYFPDWGEPERFLPLLFWQ